MIWILLRPDCGERAFQSDTFRGGNALVKLSSSSALGKSDGRPSGSDVKADEVRQMNSMPNPKQTDPKDVAIAAIKEAYHQIGRADKRLPSVNEQVSKLDAARHPQSHPSDQQSHPSDQQKRPAVPGRRPSGGRLVPRGLIAFLMATCIGAGAIALGLHGDAAKLMISSWGTQLGLISLPAVENPVLTQPSPPAVHAFAAKAEAPRPAPPQPTPAAQTAREDAAPTFAIPSPTPAQPHPSMANDLAAVEQKIGLLQASIEQLTAGIEQLKTSQEQVVRDNRELAGSFRRRRHKWLATKITPRSNLRRARNNWSVLSPSLPSRTCSPKRRFHRGRLPPRRLSRRRSFHHRKRERGRWPRGGPANKRHPCRGENPVHDPPEVERWMGCAPRTSENDHLRSWVLCRLPFLADIVF